jgi:hypothetical protein
MNPTKRLKPLLEQNENFEFHLSVDCVIFAIQDRSLKVLLTRLNPNMPWMLPGGFMTRQENAGQAASRILKDRTGVDNVYLNQFQIFSEPDRFSFRELVSKLKWNKEDLPLLHSLPERTISIGYFALVNFDSLDITGGQHEEESFWCGTEDLPELGYDHANIIREAQKALRKEVYLRPIVYKLLPEKFTLPELQALYEVILGRSLDRGSFNRKILGWGIFERLTERKEGVAHRRPYLYTYNDQKYQSAIKQGLVFGM